MLPWERLIYSCCTAKNAEIFHYNPIFFLGDRSVLAVGGIFFRVPLVQYAISLFGKRKGNVRE